MRRIIRQRTITDFPLHPGQLHLLEYIKFNSGCTQNEAAEHLMISPASVAVSTKRLEKAGLVEKKVCSDNLRCKRLYLTDRGRNLTEQCREAFNEFDMAMFSDFPEEDLEILKKYLDRLLENINKKYFSYFSNPDETDFRPIAFNTKQDKKRKKEGTV